MFIFTFWLIRSAYSKEHFFKIYCASQYSFSYLVPTVGPQAYSLPNLGSDLHNCGIITLEAVSLQPPTQQPQSWEQQHFGIMWQISPYYYYIRVFYFSHLLLSSNLWSGSALWVSVLHSGWEAKAGAERASHCSGDSTGLHWETSSSPG